LVTHLNASPNFEALIRPGPYLAHSLQPSTDSPCDNEEVQVQWILVDGHSTLAIGSKISLPRLDQNEYSEKSAGECVLSFENKILSQLIEQKIKKTCKDKTQNFKKSTQLKISENFFEYAYSFEDESHKSSKSILCKFSRIQNSRGGE